MRTYRVNVRECLQEIEHKLTTSPISYHFEPKLFLEFVMQDKLARGFDLTQMINAFYGYQFEHRFEMFNELDILPEEINEVIECAYEQVEEVLMEVGLSDLGFHDIVDYRWSTTNPDILLLKGT